MPDLSVKERYIARLGEVASECNRRLHAATYSFFALSIAFYFLTKSSSAEFDLLGAKLHIPQTTIRIAAPLILSALSYAASCFASLEDAAYKELVRLLQELGKAEKFELAPWQLKFFEFPSFYTYGELRSASQTSKWFQRAGTAADMLFFLGYGIAGLLVVIYFAYGAIDYHPGAIEFITAALSLFFVAFGFAQYFENLQHEIGRSEV